MTLCQLIGTMGKKRKLEKNTASDLDQEETPLSSEDINFFKSNSNFASFFDKLDPTKFQKSETKPTIGNKRLKEFQKEKKKRKKNTEEDEDYDFDKPRQWKKQPAQTGVLPIKTQSGDIVFHQAQAESEEPDNESTELKPSEAKSLSRKEKAKSNETKKISKNADYQKEDGAPVPRKEKRANTEKEEEEPNPRDKQQRLIVAKEEMAAVATTVMENPEKHVGELTAVLELAAKRGDFVIRRLAVLTLLTVFRDIIPGYRIRPLSEGEESATVSKEVKATREYEKQLLALYQRYLKLLDVVLKGGSQMKRRQGTRPVRGTGPQSVKEKRFVLAAVDSLCALLVEKTHFNFHINLVHTLIPRLNDPNDEIVRPVKAAFVELFRDDSKFENALEAVRGIAQFAKKLKYKTRPELLEPLEHLRLRDDLRPEAVVVPTQSFKPSHYNKKLRRKEEFLHKRQLKRNKKEIELEKELKESEAVADVNEMKKTQTAILEAVFAVYFRVLKMEAETSTSLLHIVLRGLARFAQMINVDFLGDLLSVLKRLAVKPELPVDSRLNAVVAAFRVLKGYGAALDIDPAEFYRVLYTLIMDAVLVPASSPTGLEPLGYTTATRVIECIALVLSDRRFASSQRVAAFVKRLCLGATYLPHDHAVAVLAIAYLLLSKHPRLHFLLEAEESGGCTHFNPLSEDCDSVGINLPSLWELPLLAAHFHPAVRTLARLCLQPDAKRPQAFARIAPLDLLKAYSSTGGGFNPPIPTPPAHPLKKRTEDKGTPQYVQAVYPAASEHNSRLQFLVAALQHSGEEGDSFAPLLRENEEFKKLSLLERREAVLKAQVLLFREHLATTRQEGRQHPHKKLRVA